jgi:putative Ca2+/H+ antiporter (TMEM165/GDT1 family)
VEAIFVSTGLVALAEMGDKTQLLALLLTARFRRPVPILAGILVATVANHALAAWAGFAVGQWLEGSWFRIAVGLGFLAMAAWALVPDKPDDDVVTRTGYGVFAATLFASSSSRSAIRRRSPRRCWPRALPPCCRSPSARPPA